MIHVLTMLYNVASRFWKVKRSLKRRSEKRLKLQRPLPDKLLQIVAGGEKRDEV